MIGGSTCQQCESSAWNRGIFGPFIGPRCYVSGCFGAFGKQGPRGVVGSGTEPDGRGYRFGIWLFGVDRIAAPGIGAVLWGASRGG
jgi:hypothetical protein